MILLKCYICIYSLAAGNVCSYVSGSLVREAAYTKRGNERLVMQAVDGAHYKVEENSCLYLEPATLAKKWEAVAVEFKPRKRKPAQDVEPMPRSVAGQQKWCVVDDQDRARCYYDTHADCLRAASIRSRPGDEYRCLMREML